MGVQADTEVIMGIATFAALALGLAVAFGGTGAIVCPFGDWRSFIVVFVGGLAATSVGFPVCALARLPRVLWTAAVARPADNAQVFAQLVHMAKTARYRGVLALEPLAHTHPHGLVRRGLQLLVDGVSPEVLVTAMKTHLDAVVARQEQDHRLVVVLARNWMVFAGVGAALRLALSTGLGGPGSEFVAAAAAPVLQGLVLAGLLGWPLAGRLAEIHQQELRVGNRVIDAFRFIQGGQAVEHTLAGLLAGGDCGWSAVSVPPPAATASRAEPPGDAADRVARFAAEHRGTVLATLHSMAANQHDPALQRRIEALATGYERDSVSLVAVLAALGSELRAELLRALRQTSEHVRDDRTPEPVATPSDFSFDDLARLDGRAMAALLATVDQKDLLTALWGAPAAVRAAFLGSMSARVRAFLEGELLYVDAHPAAVLDVQARVLHWAQCLTADGRIPRPGARDAQ